MSLLNFKQKRSTSSQRTNTQRSSSRSNNSGSSRRVSSSKMPANAKNTTARKAYYTALASANSNKSVSQRAREIGSSWGNATSNTKSGTSSLKLAGQAARQEAFSTTEKKKRKNAFSAR